MCWTFNKTKDRLFFERKGVYVVANTYLHGDGRAVGVKMGKCHKVDKTLDTASVEELLDVPLVEEEDVQELEEAVALKVILAL